MISIDKTNCTGCGVCESVCPEGFKITNRMADVVDSNAPCVEDAITACPFGAIMHDGPASIKDTPAGTNRREETPLPSSGAGQGTGRGGGRGMGSGSGRGLGRGPRDGRGGGKGGGGRR